MRYKQSGQLPKILANRPRSEDSSPAPAPAPGRHAADMHDLERTHFPPSGVLSKKGMGCYLRGSFHVAGSTAVEGQGWTEQTDLPLPSTLRSSLFLFACSPSFLLPFPLLFCSFSFHLFSISLSEIASARPESPLLPCFPGSGFPGGSRDGLLEL